MNRKGPIEYISSKALEGLPVVHAFLSRIGGVSGPPFDSLNFDGRDGDTPENLERNRALVEDAFSVPMGKLVTVNQVHGDGILVIEDSDSPYARPGADAIMTATRGIPIGIMTADCLPVLLSDPVKGVIAAVHAGWKGTAKAIAAKTVEAMARRFGSNPSDISAALGPYIGPCCYSVGENVPAEFAKEPGSSGAFDRVDGTLRLDIGLSNVNQLMASGVEKSRVTMTAACTSCNNGVFFSYRKDNGRTGRQLSFIMAK